MMMTNHERFRKVEQVVAELQGVVDEAVSDGCRIDHLERTLFALLLRLGWELLQIVFAETGDGDLGETVEQDERTLKRSEKKHSRRYVSIFGEHQFEQWAYAVREGQKIELRPVDQRLGLPADEHSYVLQDWLERMCVKESFQEGCASLQAMLNVRIPVGAAERINRRLAEQTERFRLWQPPPDPETEEEILVYATDCKGVPMRRSAEERTKRGHRRGKGEKANQKKMACVGAGYSIAPFIRDAEDILNEMFRKERQRDRPQPQNKQLWAEMTYAREGEPLNNKTHVVIQQAVDRHLRDPQHQKVIVCLMDGERKLRAEQEEWLPNAIGVLDIWHATEYLWKAAYCFHDEGSDKAEQFVENRLRGLLEGKIGYVIGYLRKLLNTKKLSSQRRQTLSAAITYFENNREYMKYDEYLAAGYPIGTGVVEGACRHVVKDRMEQSGMRWTPHGAQSMLHLRTIYLNDDWNDYLEHHIQNEQATLYAQNAA